MRAPMTPRSWSPPARTFCPLVAVVLALACARGAPPATNPDDVPPVQRLPHDVRPLRYALDLRVLPDRDGFQGTATIEVELARPTRRLWLHARDLEVESAVVEAGGAQVAAELVQLTPEGVARLTPHRQLPAGRAVLRFTYQGRFSERSGGLRRVRSGGLAYAVTQLQPGDARRVFPCFDEPTWKVPFLVTLAVPPEAVAVSNAPALTEDRGERGSKRVRFAETVPLTTDRLLVAVGPFEVVSGAPVPAEAARPPLPLRLFAPRGTRGRHALALEVTRALLPIEERWFGVPFPYPKLEAMVVPDFLEGSEPTAGALVHGSEQLGFDPGHSSESKRSDVAKLIARELAYQWYVDPIAPEGSQDPWQGDALATFVAWEALQRWRPEADLVADAARTMEAALDSEALAAARPVRSTAAARASFSARDLLAEVRGAAALRGVERLMGEEKFRAGVRAWLATKAQRGAGTEALVTALSSAAGREVGPAVRSLVDAPGVPLVDARAVCDAAGARIDLAVTRYRLLGAAPASGPAPWVVPVCARYEAAGTVGEACGLVGPGGGALPLPACPRWIMPAAGGSSSYRWWMGPADLPRLRDAGFAHLTAVERLSYANALAAAARAGRLPYGEALSALAPLARDGARSVATAPAAVFTEAGEQLVSDLVRRRARSALADLYLPRLRTLGLSPAPGEPLERRRLRAELAAIMVRDAREPETTHALAARGRAFAGLADDRFHAEAVSPDLAALALAAAMMEGDLALLEGLERRLASAEDAEQRANLVDAIGAARDPPLSVRALALLDGTALRPEEKLRLLLRQAAVRETREAAWDALQARWDELVLALPPRSAEQLPRIAEGFCTRGRAAEARRFFGPRVAAVPGAQRWADETIERIERCVALREAQGASAASFFSLR